MRHVREAGGCAVSAALPALLAGAGRCRWPLAYSQITAVAGEVVPIARCAGAGRGMPGRRGDDARIDRRVGRILAFLGRTWASPRSSTSRSATAMFRRLWVSAPSSTESSNGLGPLLQRARLPELPPEGWTRPSAARLGDRGSLGIDVPAPVDSAARPRRSGAELSPGAAQRHPRADLRHAAAGTRHPGPPRRRPDGRRLRGGAGRTGGRRGRDSCASRPTASPISAMARCIPSTMISPRMAPQMIGLGLLEAIPEADISRAPIPTTATATAYPAAPIASGRSSRTRWCWAASVGRRGSRRCCSSRRKRSRATLASAAGSAPRP